MKHTLYMSLRSPFARRVRLALEELGMAYDVEMIDVFNTPPGYDEINPLRRVPVLRTPDGTLIVDSWMILDHLKSLHSSHALFLYGTANAAEARALSGLAVGAMELIVASFLERARGVALVPEIFDEALQNVRRSFAALERRVAAGPGPYLTGETLRLCDLDLGSAVAYAQLRLPEALVGFAALNSYLERLNRRESFSKTVPPA